MSLHQSRTSLRMRRAQEIPLGHRAKTGRCLLESLEEIALSLPFRQVQPTSLDALREVGIANRAEKRSAAGPEKDGLEGLEKVGHAADEGLAAEVAKRRQEMRPDVRGRWRQEVSIRRFGRLTPARRRLQRAFGLT
jgi:hypothetical protein